MKQDQRRICYSVRTNLEIQKKPKKEPRKKKKQTENSLDFPIYTEFEEVLVYRDAMNNSEIQQVDVDNRHCVKSVRIQSFSGLHFHHIFPHLD